MLKLAAAFLLALLLAGPTCAAQMHLIDFGTPESGLYLLEGASIVSAAENAVDGSRALKMDSRGSGEEWNEFFRTSGAVKFTPGSTYWCSFDYHVLDPGAKETRFYSLLRSPNGEDKYGSSWLWNREKGGKGTINRLFQVTERDDWQFIIGVRHEGAIAIDNVRIYRCDDTIPGADTAARSGPTRVHSMRSIIDEMRRQDKMDPVWREMLVVWCNEGAGMKISADEPRRRFAREHQPDIVDWNLCGPLAKEFGVRSTSGGPEYQEYYKFEGEEVWERRYELFGGNGFVESLDGTYVQDETWGEGGYFTCQVAPGWHDWFTEELIADTSNMFGVCQDNISNATFLRTNGCFCPQCLSQFRDWLKARYSNSELAQMGVGDVDSFDYRERVCRYGLVGERALKDPVTRDYIKFQHARQLEAWADIVRRVKLSGRERGVPLPVYGNQVNTFGLWPFASAIGQFCDIIEIEELISVGETIPDWSLNYRMGRASGSDEKPVWVRGPVHDSTKEKTPQLSPLFWEAHFGEGLANGGVRDISFGQNAPWTGDPTTKDFIDSPELHEVWKKYADFCHEYRAQLTDRKSLARVGLIYSLPSMMYLRFHALDINVSEPFDRFVAAARWLGEQHIPYDALIFGHTELFRTAVAQLDRYDVLVVPEGRALTDMQVDLLREFVQKGGTVIAGSAPGEFDENYNPRQAQPNIPALKMDLEADAPRALRDASMVRLTQGEKLKADPWLTCDGASVDVHLVNYGADLVAGVWPERETASHLVVRLPGGFSYSSIQFLQFGKPAQELKAQASVGVLEEGADAVGQEVTLQVPEFEGYAIVSFQDAAKVGEANRAAAQRRAEDREHVKRVAHEMDLY